MQAIPDSDIHAPILAYCQDSLPGTSDSERLELAIAHGLALEVTNRGQLDSSLYQRAKVSISAVQAYRMHVVHPIHAEPERRSQALAHVMNTLEIAAQLGAPRIVTVCGFGDPEVICLEHRQAIAPKHFSQLIHSIGQTLRGASDSPNIPPSSTESVLPET